MFNLKIPEKQIEEHRNLLYCVCQAKSWPEKGMFFFPNVQLNEDKPQKQTV